MLSSISSISNENRKSAPKHERDKEEIRNSKMREPLWVNVWSRMYSDGFYLTKTESCLKKFERISYRRYEDFQQTSNLISTALLFM